MGVIVSSDLVSSVDRCVSNSASRPRGDLNLSYDEVGAVVAAADVCAIVAASVGTGLAYHWLAFGQVGDIASHAGIGIMLAMLTAVLMKLKGLYTPDSLLSVRAHIGPVVFIWTCAFVFLLAVSFTLKVSEDLSRGSILSLAIVAPALIVLERLLLRRAVLSFLRRGWLRRRRVLVIALTSHRAAEIQKSLRHYHIVGMYVLGRCGRDFTTEIGAIVAVLRGSDWVEEVHLAIDWSRWTEIKESLSELRALPLPVRLIGDRSAREILEYPQRTLSGTVSFEVQRAPLGRGERMAKRAFDVMVAALGLFCIAPMLFLVALAIKIDSPGPVFFRQNRGGFNRRAFQIVKFRTMHVMEDDETVVQVARNDQRVTRLGRWLRRASIDELPQLINVLRGDMSLVGPRPHALAHDDQYGSLISRYPFRHHVKPGLTGWAQINGFRGATSDLELMKRRVDLDLWYVGNWSFLLDIRILLWTVLEVFRSRNAF